MYHPSPSTNDCFFFYSWWSALFEQRWWYQVHIAVAWNILSMQHQPEEIRRPYYSNVFTGQSGRQWMLFLPIIVLLPPECKNLLTLVVLNSLLLLLCLTTVERKNTPNGDGCKDQIKSRVCTRTHTICILCIRGKKTKKIGGNCRYAIFTHLYKPCKP